MKKVVKSLIKKGFNYLIFERFSAKLSQLKPSPSLYEEIFKTKPLIMTQQCNVELHMLVCKKDFLRSFWSLKSFFYYSGLSPRLVIQNDGSLTSEMIELYKEHFPHCIVNTNNDDQIRDALTGYPMCQFFVGHHVMSKKLLHPLLLSQSEYILTMDSDILWFKQSKVITKCVQNILPFYVYGGSGAYVRNQKFMEAQLGLYPANNVNAGIVGYQKSKFLDLEFIESAIHKLVDIPKDLILESVGYVDESVNINSEDINQTLCWWVMEQTIYALLLGRESQRQALKCWSNKPLDLLFADLHQFTNSPIMRGTALIHYISDARHNQFFPAGVQHLIKRGFLAEISK
ncbi:MULTISPECIES: hypothetical protein [unclassified Nodularia (in: cyanobacteria)]|uniref:hypothetical protein n=1 Tax=unclassified Nodularia (in: cyanobacteria) TaxID=2656917 RepID=UPI00187EE5E8|nr:MULTISPECIES: hypothetical protein [unclassified Nodularia (in: cyanobacteria)]MBE9201574.1 hypothetical protein [Nodularia sp. LEGE 06071]MCC2694467.1 hypothetical protein [Nodularia sp. LEGE 04288]